MMKTDEVVMIKVKGERRLGGKAYQGKWRTDEKEKLRWQKREKRQEEADEEEQTCSRVDVQTVHLS